MEETAEINVVEILDDSNPVLREVSLPVESFDDDLKTLATTMWLAMMARRGIGLSAVQIGELKRVIIVRFDNEQLIMVNPTFIRKGNRESVDHEGCLSIDRSKWRYVSRPAKCEVVWFDVDGAPHSRNFSGMLAKIVQHEMDHLDGILITDKPIVPVHQRGK